MKHGEAVRRAVIGRIIAVALGMATLASCALMRPAETGTSKAVLNKMPLELPRREPRAVTLLVFPPEAKPLFDTTQMAYTVRPYQVAYFREHEWGETPPQMLQPLLVKTLENTRYFSAVLTPPYTARYTYALRTEILELTQDFTSEPPAVLLSLRLRLSDGATDRVIAIKEIALREPMQQKTPESGVVAANEATAKALKDAAKFVLDNAN